MFFTLLVSFLQGFTVLVESFNTDSMNSFSHYGKELGYEPTKSVFVLFVIILILITFCFLMPVGFLVYI